MLKLIINNGSEELIYDDIPADIFERKVVVSQDVEGVQVNDGMYIKDFGQMVNKYNELVSKYNACMATIEGLRKERCAQDAVCKGLFRRAGYVSINDRNVYERKLKDMQERLDRMTDNYQRSVERCEELMLEVDRLKKM